MGFGVHNYGPMDIARALGSAALGGVQSAGKAIADKLRPTPSPPNAGAAGQANPDNKISFSKNIDNFFGFNQIQHGNERIASDTEAAKQMLKDFGTIATAVFNNTVGRVYTAVKQAVAPLPKKMLNNLKVVQILLDVQVVKLQLYQQINKLQEKERQPLRPWGIQVSH